MRFRKTRGILFAAAAVFSLQLFSPVAKAEGDMVLLNDLVDKAQVSADAWQNDTEGDPPSVFPPADAFAQTSISTDSGIAAADIRRFCSSLNVNYAHHKGAPTMVDGVATTSLIIPFSQTVELEQLKMIFSMAHRRYYFNLYTSMDGEEWTFAELNGGAESIHLLEAYNARGEVVDITEEYLGCYASDPAGAQGEYDKVSTLTLKTPVAAKYLKITLYGNDGASGEDKVKNQWVSFNNLQLFGSKDVKVTEKPTEPSAKTDGKPAPSENGGHWIVWVVVAAGVVVVAGVVTAVVLAKKRKK